MKSFGVGASFENDADIEFGLILPPDNRGSLPGWANNNSRRFGSNWA